MNHDTDIKIIIAEDYQLYREGVINNIGKEEGLNFIGQAENGIALLELLKTETADIVLMDINMPVMDGITATKEVVAQYPDTKVIALTMYDNDDAIVDMLEGGASGYLLKSTERSEIVTAIFDVYNGKKGYDKFINAKLIELISKNKYYPHTSQSLLDLSATELEVVKLLCKSYSAKEIGDMLKMNYRTIEGYKSRLLTKFDVKNTTGIVIYAIKNKLVRVEEL